MLKNLKEKEVKLIANNLSVRLWVVRKLFELFFIIYFQEYIIHSLANYQFEIMKLAMDERIKLLCILAFRGSAKTTILTQSFPIWSVLCNNKKFVLIISKSAWIAKLFLENIKLELETNELLKSDFWLNKANTIFRKTQINIFDSIIKVANVKTSLRWLKRWKYRPDLIICDDIEDIESIKTPDLREKLYTWFKKEVLTLGWENTKIIFLWNYLSKTSLLNTIIEEINDREITGEYRKYPIIDFEWNILWDSKYTREELENLKDSIWDNKTWYNEYLLTWIPSSINTIKKEDFVYFKDEILLDMKWAKSSWVYIDFNKGLEKKDKSLVIKTATFWINYNNTKYYIYNKFTHEKLTKNQIIEKYDDFKQNLVTKRKRIYAYKDNIPNDLYNELESRDFNKWILFRRNESNPYKLKKLLNYNEKFELLLDLIENKQIFFQEWSDFIIDEILEYWIDENISKFMKQFLDFIDYMIDSTFRWHSIVSIWPSQFWFDPVDEQENYYDFEKEDFYSMEWKWKIVDEEYVLRSYEDYNKGR